MSPGWIATAGLLLAAGAATLQVQAWQQAQQRQERDEEMTEAADRLAATAATVLQNVEARTGALEALLRQLITALPAMTQAAAAPHGRTAAPRRAKAAAPPTPYSPVVRQVMALAAQGLESRAIADRLSLSRSQVEVALRLSGQFREEV